MPLTPAAKKLVIGLVVFIIVGIPGIPGVGFETRGSTTPAWVAIAFTIVGAVLPILGIALAWKWPRVSGVLSIVAALGFLILNVLDLAHALVAIPPPVAIEIDEVVVGVTAIVLAWLGWQTARPS